MRRRSERSLVLFAAIFVFACLLLSGGPRLIGHEETGSPTPCARESLPDARLCAMPAPQAELAVSLRSAAPLQRSAGAHSVQQHAPRAAAITDANGNILHGLSYLHEVYQAFSLGDGFV